ncbi:MAG: hypothetical protein C0501_02545 [Isosphaera sp.]|nr:hypothetical protein [Isosphaera sp.]
MPVGLDRVVAHVVRVAEADRTGAVADAELLERYIRHRDPAAFEVLVRRHGSMVLAACRRVLRIEQDAEDAFQATFLVLVRKADSVRPRALVASWLYGVAVRVALRVRLDAGRRLQKEHATARPGTVEPIVGDDSVSVLDEVLSLLPAKYREPVVLCDLQGLTRTEAARRLGWPEGSVAGRLARARELLANQLRRRGLAASAVTLGLDLSRRHAAAAVPAAVVSRSVQLAAGTGGVVTGAIAPELASIANEVGTAMTIAKLKAVALLGVLAATLGLGAATWGYPAWADGTPAPAASARGAAPARPAQPRERGQPDPKTRPFDLNQFWSRGRAVGQGPVKLTIFPLKVEDTGRVLPMGMMVGGHVTPSDHLYIVPKDPKAADDHYDVLAVADGFIVQIQRPPAGNPDPAVTRKAGEYKLVLEHSATCWSYLGLINSLDPAVAKAAGEIKPGPAVAVRVPVKAGQVIGKTGGGHSFDFALVDTAVTRKGFAVPDQFRNRDPWKPHTVDPFDYLDEPLKGRLMALNPRTAEPRGGRIDYDAAGRLVGNWYKEKTGGYAGLNKRLDYWVGHLTIAYHHIDPSVVIVSLGDFDGKPRQFAVAGNGPDPGKVSAKDGVVTYELQYAGIGNSGQPIELARELRGPQGVLLVQVLDGGKLKVEVLPGKAAKDVTGFTAAAATYER